jgi:hypothetical protein
LRVSDTLATGEQACLTPTSFDGILMSSLVLKGGL